MSYKDINFNITDGLAILTLNRPKSLNSFTKDMHDQVRDAFYEMDSEPMMRCLLITGTGRGFCAGQDLAGREVKPGAKRNDLSVSLEEDYNPLIRRITALPFPVICAVNGVAAGAGANIALACDIVLAAKSAKFIQAFCKIGLVPDSGGTYNLPRLIGLARARAICLTGEAVPAEKAAHWGMIWKAVDDEVLMSEALALARHFTSQPTKGLALIKRALNASFDNDLDAQLDLERDFQGEAGFSDDYQEGVSAFLAKRSPNFTGQ